MFRKSDSKHLGWSKAVASKFYAYSRSDPFRSLSLSLEWSKKRWYEVNVELWGNKGSRKQWKALCEHFGEHLDIVMVFRVLDQTLHTAHRHAVAGFWSATRRMRGEENPLCSFHFFLSWVWLQWNPRGRLFMLSRLVLTHSTNDSSLVARSNYYSRHAARRTMARGTIYNSRHTYQKIMFLALV